MSEMVSTTHEPLPEFVDDAEQLTQHILNTETPLHDGACCAAPDPTSGLSPAAMFLAIAHTNGITDVIPVDWETRFETWWEVTGGNLALIRTALDAFTYAYSTGVNIPDRGTYLDVAITDITVWTSSGEDEPWNIHTFEARTLGHLLTGLEQIDPGAYTHPLHQLVHTALHNAEERSVTGVYGWLCTQGAMGYPTAPYNLHQLRHLAEGGTI